MVNGSWDQETAKRWTRSLGGVSGTIWKKKSRQGLPEERNVGDKFSVRPIGGRSSRASAAVLEIRFWSVETGVVTGFMIGVSTAATTEGGPRRAVVEEAIEERRDKEMVIWSNDFL